MQATELPAVPGRALGAWLAMLLVGTVLAAAPAQPSAPLALGDPLAAIPVLSTNYQGWPGSLTMRTRTTEAVIVPQVGRVMQFRFRGQTGPWWENPALFGRVPDPKSKEWGNFGGDKTWPAPQADWAKITPRAWPPPVAFDSMPVEVQAAGSAVLLTSAVDPHYGIRVRRHVTLDAAQPIMRIITEYEKVSGLPNRVGVWIITQLDDPVAVYAPVPPTSRFPDGYVKQSGGRPLDLKRSDGLLFLRRSHTSSEKLGTDASALLWVGKELMVLIESPRSAPDEYPDGGSSAEVYTNRDPLTYVELEMLGPLRTLCVGDRLSQTNTYTLLRRSAATPEVDARKALAPYLR